MKQFCIAIISISLLAACGGGDPDFHVPKSTMQHIMLDVNIAEAYSMQVKDPTHRRAGKNNDSLAFFYKEILNHYHLTPQQFSENLDWYKRHPDMLDSIYLGIATQVSGWQTRYNPVKPAKVYPSVKVPFALPAEQPEVAPVFDVYSTCAGGL